MSSLNGKQSAIRTITLLLMISLLLWVPMPFADNVYGENGPPDFRENAIQIDADTPDPYSESFGFGNQIMIPSTHEGVSYETFYGNVFEIDLNTGIYDLVLNVDNKETLPSGLSINLFDTNGKRIRTDNYSVNEEIKLTYNISENSTYYIVIGNHFVVDTTSYTFSVSSSSTGIKGQIKDDSGNGLYANVSVYTYNTDSNSFENIFTASSDANGYYALSLESGSYVLKFHDDNGQYVSVFNDGTASVDDATPIEVTNKLEECNVNLIEVISGIQGQITNSEGEGIPGHVTVYNTEFEGMYTSFPSDVNGRFKGFLPEGDYRIEFQGSNSEYKNAYYIDEDSPHEDKSIISITEGEYRTCNISLEELTSGIYGTVTNDDGEFISGNLTIYSYNDFTSDWYYYRGYYLGVRDTDYQLILPPGKYQVRFEADDMDYEPINYFDEINEADFITVEEDQLTQCDMVIPKLTSGITGKIIDESGEPVRATITAYYQNDEGGWNIQRSIKTNSQGEYTLLLKNNDYKVKISHPSHKTVYYSKESSYGVSDIDMASLINVDNDVKTCDSTLKKINSGIKGQIKDKSENGLEGTVQVYYKEQWGEDEDGGALWTGDDEFDTDENGNYSLLLQPGEYKLRFSSENKYKSVFNGGATNVNDADEINVIDGEYETCDATLEELTSCITGKLKNESGDPVDGEITAYSLDDSDTIKSAYTYDEGNYCLYLDPGTYEIVFSASRYKDAYYMDDESNMSLTIGEDETIQHDQVMELANSVTGKVVDTTGDAIQGVSVELGEKISSDDEYGEGGNYDFSDIDDTVTDSSGEFTLYGIEDGSDYILSFYHNDYISTSSAFSVTEDDSITIEEPFVLQSGLNVSGIVKDKSGVPISDATVELEYESVDADSGEKEWHESNHNAQTDNQGRYTIKGIRPSEEDQTYRVTARHDNYFTSEPVEFNMSNQNVVGVDIEMTKCGYISGMIKDSAGDPIQDATIVAFAEGVDFSVYEDYDEDEDGEPVGFYETSSDEEGNYTITGLQDGNYKLYVKVWGDQYVETTQFSGNGDSLEGADPIEVSADNPATGKDFTFALKNSSHGISLSQTTDYTFDSKVEGYSNITPLQITVTGTGSEESGNLNITLGGINAGDFVLNKELITSLNKDATDTFTVTPTNSLEPGTYTANVSVTNAENNINKSFDVTFVVTAKPTNIVITFDPDGGSVTPTTKTATTGQSYGTLPEPQKSGYNFAGWFNASGSPVKATDTVTATTDMTLKAKWTKIDVGNLTISAPPKYIQVGDTHQFTASITPDTVLDKTVKWQVSNANAIVDANGAVTGNNEGSVTLTATAGDKVATQTIIIVSKVTKITTSLTNVKLTYKKSYTPSITCSDGNKTVKTKMTWKSSNPKIASVNSSTGKITAKSKKGKASITGTAANGKPIKITVNVQSKAVKLKKFTISGLKSSHKKGSVANIKIKANPKGATNITPKFSTSKSSVATIDKSGKVTFKNKGKVTITVKAGGKTVKKKVTVKL